MIKAGKNSVTREDHTLKAYNGIRQMLFHNEISPGQKISYGDLASRLDMSPTPVIQALKRLEFQGLVRREPNRGYFTEPISLKEVREIYEIRELMECSLLPGALGNLNVKGIDLLEKALKAHTHSARNGHLSERLIKDMEFHLTLASLSDCHIQQKILRDLFDLLYLKYRGSILFMNFMQTVDSDHKEIFDAVVSRDVDGAQKALSKHILRVKRHVLEGLDRIMADKKRPAF
jgi:DNA-binding GntR family transcriptional regulator